MMKSYARKCCTRTLKTSRDWLFALLRAGCPGTRFPPHRAKTARAGTPALVAEIL